MTEKHEGWTNYETWGVAMIIDNERTYLERMTTVAAKFAKEHPDEWYARETFADALRDDMQTYHDEQQQTTPAGAIRHHLAGAGLARVNWRELAEHYITKAREGVTA